MAARGTRDAGRARGGRGLEGRGGGDEGDEEGGDLHVESARGEDHRSRHFSTLPARTLVRSIHRVGLFVGEEKTLAWITPFVVTLVNDKLWSVRAEFKRASPLLGALIGEDYLTPLANVVTS